MHIKHRQEKNHPLFNHSQKSTTNNLMYVLPVFSMHILFHIWDYAIFYIWIFLTYLYNKNGN